MKESPKFKYVGVNYKKIAFSIIDSSNYLKFYFPIAFLNSKKVTKAEYLKKHITRRINPNMIP